MTILCPDVVLDVGANYGEFVFGERYPDQCRIIAIEANPELDSFLRKSLRGHPDRERIQILCALASEKTNVEHAFYIDKDWTGRSSAVPRKDANTTTTTVRSVAIDDLLADLCLADRTLIFKIDVEGFEPAVLAGMTRVLQEAKMTVGIMEFNSRLIEQSGVSPQAFVDRLFNDFNLIALPHKRPAIQLAVGTINELCEIDGRKDVELDLLAYSRSGSQSHEALIAELLRPDVVSLNPSSRNTQS